MSRLGSSMLKKSKMKLVAKKAQIVVRRHNNNNK